VDAAAFLGVGAVCEIDYGDAGVPMLTETHGRTVTRKHHRLLRAAGCRRV
jgi:heme O synthase-like polyprenyltransferase